MIIDLAGNFEKSVESANFVIVGGGTVGLFIAVLLSRKSFMVTVVESGGVSHEIASSSLNDSINIGRKHDGLLNGRARVLGGTSTLWGGQLTKFIAQDLEPRFENGGSKWPISYDELESHYTAVGSVLGLDVEMLDDNKLKKILGTSDVGFEKLELIYTRWLKCPNFATYFAEEIKNSPSLTVYTHATSVNLEFIEAGNNVTISGVGVVSTDKKITVRGEKFILANGTIEISRFLLWTASLNSKLPWANNKWLGKSFQDHLDIRVGSVVIKDKKFFSNLFENVILSGHKYQPKLTFLPALLKNEKMSNIASSLIFSSKLSTHLDGLKLLVRSIGAGSGIKYWRSFPRHLFGAIGIWAPLVYRYLLHNRIYSPSDEGVTVNLHCEQVPVYQSQITLSENRLDRFGMKLAELNWIVDGTVERFSVSKFCQYLKEDLHKTGLGEFTIDSRFLEKNTSFLLQGRDSFHQCGGARMSVTEEDGVVDANMKVFGTTNLYVAGAATFPSSSFANPTFTALAFCNRLVEHISTGRKLF